MADRKLYLQNLQAVARSPAAVISLELSYNLSGLSTYVSHARPLER